MVHLILLHDCYKNYIENIDCSETNDHYALFALKSNKLYIKSVFFFFFS